MTVPDSRRVLSDKGYTSSEVEAILRHAAELQHQAEKDARGVSRAALEGGAEAAGIPKEYIEQAIADVRVQREREAARRAEHRRRLLAVGGAVLAILLVAVFYSQSILNARLAAVEENQAQLENVLQRRHDLIPNLIALAKTSAAHEEALTRSVSEIYRELGQTRDFERRQRLEQALDEGLVRLLTRMRANPEASSTTLFVRLSDELAGAENRIAVERKRYNEVVAAYNRTARSFPVSLMRPVLGFPSSIPMFQASTEALQPPRI
jgi:LemA protein